MEKSINNFDFVLFKEDIKTEEGYTVKKGSEGRVWQLFSGEDIHSPVKCKVFLGNGKMPVLVPAEKLEHECSHVNSTRFALEDTSVLLSF